MISFDFVIKDLASFACLFDVKIEVYNFKQTNIKVIKINKTF